ncbi:Tn3 family transposase [Thalassobaculum litoreum]|uniref:Tn3 family transposase n=1 Tax=Thalassobaculum litoreum TaxID=420996 RepID=UPI000B8089BA
MYLERAADHLRARGAAVPDTLLAHVSPMSCSHIGLTGDYLWEQVDLVTPGSFRELNGPAARLRSVAQLAFTVCPT